MADSFLLAVGPCLLVGGFVEHCPVVCRPWGLPEQAHWGVGIGCFVLPAQSILHTINVPTKLDDSECVLVFPTVKDINFLPVNLHDGALQCSECTGAAAG